jgi:hypothetical protein
MQFEKTQKGNPHKLSIKQHIFPVRSIERYLKIDGTAEVYLKSINKSIQTNPYDQIFCALRGWDHGTEIGYMKSVEDKFQALAELILDGSTISIGLKEKEIVNEFYGLWNLRSYYEANPIGDQNLQGIPGDDLTLDTQEMLEKHGVGFIRPDATVPGRQMTGLRIIIDMIPIRKQLEVAQWGIIRSSQGEFIVPDNFSNNQIVPITPNLCLYSPSRNAILSIVGIREVNRLAIQSSQKYYFAKDLSKCPV